MCTRQSARFERACCASRTRYLAAGRVVIAVIVAKCLFKYRRLPPRRYRCRRSVYLLIFLLSPLQLHAAPLLLRRAGSPVAVAGTPSHVLLSYSSRCYYCRLFCQIVSNRSSVLNIHPLSWGPAHSHFCLMFIVYSCAERKPV